MYSVVLNHIDKKVANWLFRWITWHSVLLIRSTGNHLAQWHNNLEMLQMASPTWTTLQLVGIMAWCSWHQAITSTSVYFSYTTNKIWETRLRSDTSNQLWLAFLRHIARVHYNDCMNDSILVKWTMSVSCFIQLHLVGWCKWDKIISRCHVKNHILSSINISPSCHPGNSCFIWRNVKISLW